MKKNVFIFDLFNKCKGTLTGPGALIYTFQRYTVFGHLRTFKNAFAYGACQLSLKCSKDGRIFYLPQFKLAYKHLKSVIWASPQKIVRSLFKVVINFNTGSISDLFLPLDRNDRTNDRQLKFKNKTCLSNLLGGLGDLFFPSLKNFTPSNCGINLKQIKSWQL